MANRLEIYKCVHCGIIAEVLHSGGGQMICCNEPMKRMVENTTDAAKEKHVPVVTKVDGGFKVAVGSVPHPMTEEHMIEWIELQVGNNVCRKCLQPGDAPEVTFCVDAEEVTARAYCNLHGLWKGE